MKKEECTCRFSKCSHSSKILPKSEAVKVGNAYYHTDCYKNKKNIEDIEAMFKQMNRFVVPKQLRGVLNTLIFDKGVSSDYIKFVVSYCLENGRELRNPPGLYYMIQDKDIESAWKSKQAAEFMREVRETCDAFVLTEDSGNTFEYKGKQKSFDNVLI